MKEDNAQYNFFPPRKPEIKAPEGYFEALPDRIMARIEKENHLPQKLRMRITLIWRWAAAAVIVAALGITMMTTWSGKDDFPLAENEVENEEIMEAYVSSDIDEYSLFTIAHQGDDEWMWNMITEQSNELEIYNEY